MKNIARKIPPVLAGLATLWLTGCVNPMFYQPDRRLYQTPANTGLAYEEIRFASKDGTKLAGWFIPAVGTNAVKGTVIHCHGNAQNMSSHFLFVNWLPQQGFHLFVFDYRGYGASAGKPDRQGVFDDTVAAIECVRNRKDIDPEKIVVFGQSLGAANALAVLGENINAAHAVRGIAADSSFFSYRQIVRDKIKTIPVLSWFRWPLSFVVVSNRHSPGNAVGCLPGDLPLMILHGKSDRIVPFEHARELFAAAHDPKMMVTADDCGHTEAILKNPIYRAQLAHFFETVLAPAAP